MVFGVWGSESFKYMELNLKKITFVLFLVVFLGRLYSQTDTIKTYYLNPVTITGSKYELSVKNFNPSTTYIQNDVLKTSAKAALFSSIEGRAPGLFITERGYAGFGISTLAAGKISMRGLSGTSQTLVVVDGKPEYAGVFGHPLPDGYASSEIEAVEVIRGPASVIYGPGAMAGGINITTKKGLKQGINLSSELNYGAFGTLKASGAVGYKTENYGTKISVDLDKSDGDRPSSSYNSKIASINSFYNINKNWSIDAEGYVNRSKVYNPGTVTAPFPNDSAWTDVTRANAEVSVKNKFAGLEGVTRFYFNNGMHDIYDGFHSRDYTFGFSAMQGLSGLCGEVITVGADFKRYGGIGRSFNFKSKIVTVNVDTALSEGGVYAVIDQPVVSNVAISAGARLHNHSVYGTQFIPQVILRYQPFKVTELHASVSKGFRNPTLTELFLSPIFQKSQNVNPNLKPEISWNYEIGLNQKAIDDKLNLALTTFLMEGQDMIVTEGVRPFVMYKNSGNFRNRGIETEISYKVLPELFFDANYSYIVSDKKNTGVPKQLTFAECVYKTGIISLSASIRNVTDLITSSSPYKTQSFALIGAQASVNPVPEVSVYVKGENLTDRKYEINAGYPMPGASIIAGITYNGIF